MDEDDRTDFDTLRRRLIAAERRADELEARLARLEAAQPDCAVIEGMALMIAERTQGWQTEGEYEGH